jgi:hypothetical protein
MKAPGRVLVWTSLALAPLALSAQILTFGPEFPVNTYTTAQQLSPAVAAAPDGSFVVVWTSESQDGDLGGVVGQRYNRFGAKAGAEFQVNTYTTGGQGVPAIATDVQGNFVVVWKGAGSGDPTGIFAQRYDANGAPIGGEFRVNTTTSLLQENPAIAMAPDGRFVVVWERPGILGQRFDATGAKAGGEFEISKYPGANRSLPAVATDAAGRFVVVWTAYLQDGDSDAVFGQRFDAAGAKVGSAFQVNTYTTGVQDYPAIAMDRTGNFVVVWESVGQVGGGFIDLFGQRFNAGAEKLGAEIPVNAYTTDAQEAASVALEADGGFDVMWQSFGEDGDGNAIAGQRFDRTGARRGFGLLSAEFVGGNQTNPRIATSPSGLVVAWTGYDGDEMGVRAKRLRLQPFALHADDHGDGNSDTNGVIEPGEAVRIEPTWANRGPGLATLQGTVAASGFTGPAGPNYSLFDGLAEYGTLLVGLSATCSENPNPCYAVQVGGTRPAPHWDATLTENLTHFGSQVWTLHIGESFSDVPRSQTFYKKIETLLHNGITLGCTATQYCPATSVSRGQMGIFIAKGIAGAGELVPTAGLLNGQPYNCSPGGISRFSDVSPTDSFCRHVHYLAAQNVTLGCSSLQYCPTQTITRDAMASFIAKAIVAPGGGNAVPLTYSDSATGRSYSCANGSPNLHFTDVPVSNAFCKHIHYLWARGIVEGCSATQYCPGASVLRDAMAKFIANGFGLQLYGP